jgi:hypothetical protein
MSGRTGGSISRRPLRFGPRLRLSKEEVLDLCCTLWDTEHLLAERDPQTAARSAAARQLLEGRLTRGA